MINVILPLVAPVFHGRLDGHHGGITQRTDCPTQGIATYFFYLFNIPRLSLTAFDRGVSALSGLIRTSSQIDE